MNKELEIIKKISDDAFYIKKYIYDMTINIRNGLQQYDERRKEVTILNNIIDLLLYDNRLILEEDMEVK